MTFTPTLSVQFAFGFGPYDEPVVGTADWVDVSDDAYEISVTRGRSSEFEDFPASTCTIGLFNDERQYDPLNTAGTHYGELVANVPVQIRATVGISTFTVWRGLVDGWPATYEEGGFRSTTKVSCTDAFKILAERPMHDTHRAFLEDFGAPDGWYRFDSVDGGLLRNDGTYGRPAVIEAQLTTTDPLLAISAGAVQVPEQAPPDGARAYAARAPVLDESFGDNLVDGAIWSFTITVLLTEPGVRFLFTNTDDEDVSIARLVLDTDGFLDAVVSAGVTLVAEGEGYYIADGLPHHIVVVRDTETLSLYVDGQLIAEDFDAGATGAIDGTGGRMTFGGTNFGSGGASYPAYVMDEFMAWKDRALTASEVADLYAEMTTGFEQTLLSGAAIAAILDEIGWPASLRALDEGEILVHLPANPGGASTLGLLQNIARSESGRLFVDRVGRITFHDRSRFYTEASETAAQYTFTDTDRDDPTPPDVGLLDGTLSITVDDRLTFDAAEVTREGGVTQRSALTATPARTYQASGLPLATDGQALALAEWITFRYATPQPRSDEWQIDPEIRPADWDNILGLEIGHRIKHEITPGGVGSAIELEQHVSVIGHEITPDQWLITMNGSPVDPNEAAYFLWAATETADNDNGWGDPDGTPPGGYWG